MNTLEKFDCIRQIVLIDPPYNTGNDFVYKDDFKDNIENYLEVTGQKDEYGNKTTTNTESNGRYHSNWLNMIYPRLKLARNLLKDDGVIFISIDDNEVDNLKKICDEIFGEFNFVNRFTWVSNITGRQISGKGAAKTWETILVYSKNINSIGEFNIDINFAKSKMPDAYKGFNKDIRKDSIGEFAVGDTLYNHNRKFNEETRPNLVFSIFYNPVTEKIIPGNIGEVKEGFIELLPHSNGDGVHKYHAWRWSKNKIINEGYNLIVLPTSSGGYEIYTRIRDFKNTLLKDLITNISNGDKQVQKLFNGKKYFDYPKATDLLQIFINALYSGDEIVLDFFSGSSTTADSVMQLNKEDKGNRKFIMIQLPEKMDKKSEAYKAGYKNICEIGKERIRRAGEKIKEENKDKEGIEDLDIGFKVFKLDSSNINKWDSSFEQNLEQSLLSSIENIKEGRTEEDILYEILLKYGIDLNMPIEERIIAGKKVFDIGFGAIIACLDENISLDVVEGIGKLKEELKPDTCRVVFMDNGFSSDSIKTNAVQILKRYNIEDVKSI